jgi:hypothetical protein
VRWSCSLPPFWVDAKVFSNILSRDINPVLRLRTADFLGRRKSVAFAMRLSVRPSAALSDGAFLIDSN